MSFIDVYDKIKFQGVYLNAEHAENRDAILEAMQTAYEGSATAKEMFDNWISKPANNEIEIYFKDHEFHALGLNAGKLELDISKLNKRCRRDYFLYSLIIF